MAVDLMEQVGQMLAQAESTEHAGEAEVIWARLQTLASRYQIDLAKVQQDHQKAQRREEPTVKTIEIGKRTLRERRFYVDLFLAIARSNDVTCDIGSTATYVVAYGFPSDIKLVELLYASLVHRMVSDAAAYLATGEHLKQVQSLPVKKREPNPYYGDYGEPKYLYHWTYEDKPLSGLTVRRNFYEAFTGRIGKRLRDARKEAIAEVKAEEELVAASEQAPPQAGTDLVLLRKEEEIRDYYKSTSNAKGHYRGGSVARYSDGGRNAGRSSADSAHLGRADRELPAHGKGIER